MTDSTIQPKDTVEIPARALSIKVSRAALTSRVPLTEYTKQGDFAENEDLLSDKPLRRPLSRALPKAEA